MASVHQISVQIGSGHNLISLDEWSKMPAPERIGLITQRKVQFLDETGDSIPAKTALEDIKARAA